MCPSGLPDIYAAMEKTKKHRHKPQWNNRIGKIHRNLHRGAALSKASDT